MRLKKLHIENYRQFIDSTINFENDITVLAGSNNSGKTSLVELFNNIFYLKKCNYCEDDVPITISKEWIDDVYIAIKGIYKNSSNKYKNIEDILNLFNGSEIEENRGESTVQKNDKKLMKYTSVNIEITYEEGENISKFADYLMDLDETVRSFFFRFEFSLNMKKLQSNIEQNYSKLSSRFTALDNEEIANTNKVSIKNKETSIKEKFVALYIQSLEEKYYFTDKHYTNKIQMETKDFKNLFNFNYINANRLLDDEVSDKNHSISKGMVNFISNDEEWESLIKDLPDKIIQPIESTGIKEKIRKKSLDGLSKVINSISKTNGGFSEEIALDMDIDDESIKLLLKNITSAKYIVDEFYLKETAQGLGYSNMIYIHLELEKYLKQIDLSIVNFFIIEEPEAHMHPQMQKVFIKYLFNYYKEQKIQGLVTSHSSEIVKVTPINKLRVIRQLQLFKNKIYDMNIFMNEIEDIGLVSFYNLLFNINFSDIIFSDKIVMYEGDTERMYIQNILKLEKFEKLDNQYIAFIQVGGAYAHNYRRIVEYLHIKTLALTDIDYDKAYLTEEEILESKTTNAAIKAFYKDDMGQDNPDIKEIYKWKYDKVASESDSCTLIKFQGKEDAYSRTLEEAMLAKYFNMKMNDVKTKAEWQQKRNDSKLQFVIPREVKSHNIRDIVNSTSDSKTDFMYSVIMNNLVEKMLPNYILEGLEWLMK